MKNIILNTYPYLPMIPTMKRHQGKFDWYIHIELFKNVSLKTKTLEYFKYFHKGIVENKSMPDFKIYVITATKTIGIHSRIDK